MWYGPSTTQPQIAKPKKKTNVHIRNRSTSGADRLIVRMRICANYINTPLPDAQPTVSKQREKKKFSEE